MSLYYLSTFYYISLKFFFYHWFFMIYKLYRRDSLWQFLIVLYSTLKRSFPPSLLFNPLPAPLKVIARGFCVLYHMWIWSPSTISPHLNLKILDLCLPLPFPENQHSNKKQIHELNKEFSKEEVQVSNKYIKKCSTSRAVKAVQIKATLRFHLTPVRKTIFKGKNNNKCW
jgi:hypothetical protein